MSQTSEIKLLNLAQIFSLIDNNNITMKDGAKLLNYSYWHFIKLYHQYQTIGLADLFQKDKPRNNLKLSHDDIVLLKNLYLKLDKPQMSLLHYFLYLDYPSFPKISSEWIRKILIRENIYSPGLRKKIFRKRVVRALSELGIEVINTTPFDPCGKGKIERFLQMPSGFFNITEIVLEVF